METSRNKHADHFFAGAAGGTVGAIVTCPLEVVKTRLQSSVATFHHPVPNIQTFSVAPHSVGSNYSTWTHKLFLPNKLVHESPRPPSLGIWMCLRYIVKTEGPRGLFRGLGPNLVGVAPTRAIFFYTYAYAKEILNRKLKPDAHLIPILSSLSAGIVSNTAANPIWFVKTRLQLDQTRTGSAHYIDIMRRLYQENGIRGFYKGITASYFGLIETVIHWLIYEELKAELMKNDLPDTDGTELSSIWKYMVAGAASKICATTLAYPHEVARTRLRQEGTKYKKFIQTLVLVAREEGRMGLYRGLVAQLVRQIPNNAIMIATYELVAHLFSRPG